MESLTRIIKEQKSLVLFILLFFLMTIFIPQFFTARNIQNVLLQIAVNGVVAAGMTVVIITGGFDLSVGSVMALSGVFAVKVLPEYGLALAVLVGLLVGTAIGVINGLLVSRVGINPFIATLASMVTVRGFTMGFTDGRPISVWHEGFYSLGLGTLWGVPISAIVLLVALILLTLFLVRVRYGRYIYVCGGNAESGYMAGVPVKRVLTVAYAISGFMAGLSGILLAARLGTGSPVIAEDAPLIAIASVVLGGTSLKGGSGSVFRTLIGVLIFGCISNGLNLMNVPSYYQILIRGFLVVMVVASDSPTLRKLFYLKEQQAKEQSTA